MQSYDGGKLSPEQALIVAAGGGRKLAESAAAIADFLKAGGHLLALGLDEEEANAFLPFKVGMTKAEHIASCFEPPAANSLLSGVAPADVHNRDPRKLPLVSAGATVLGDGVLAQAENANVVFFQFPPYTVTDAAGSGVASEQLNLRRTYRRTSVALARLLANMGVCGADAPVVAFLDAGGRRPAEARPLGRAQWRLQPGRRARRDGRPVAVLRGGRPGHLHSPADGRKRRAGPCAWRWAAPAGKDRQT